MKCWHFLAFALVLIANVAPASAGPELPGRPQAGRGSLACTPAQKKHAQDSLAAFKRGMAAQRRAYFKTHPKANYRRAFLQRQRARLKVLQNAVARCSAPAPPPPAPPPSPPPPPPPPPAPPPAPPPPAPLPPPSTGPPCSPFLSPGSNGALPESPTDLSAFLRSTGELHAVMIFVDFADAPQSERTEDLFTAIVPDAVNWYREASYGRLSLNVTPVHKWYRMPKASTDYGLSQGVEGDPRGTSSDRARAYVQDAIAVSDPDVDYRPYDLVYIVSSKGAALPYSPAQHLPMVVDGKTILKEVTFGADVRGGAQYGSHVLVHETGHLLGLPDLYDLQIASFPDWMKYAGAWDMMSWIGPGPHFLAWHKWKLGWLEPEQLSCLEAPGQLEETLSPLETPGGVKALVVPSNERPAYGAGAVFSNGRCDITQPRSGSGGPAPVTFVNQTSGSVTLYWLDRSGNRVSYGSIGPGAQKTQQTFVQDAWLAVDSSGTCVGYFLVDQPSQTFVVTSTSAPAAPWPFSAYVIEVRQPLGHDSRLCDKGVLLYTVDARIPSGSGPIRVLPSQAGSDPAQIGRCGALYNAPFDVGPGEVSTYEDTAIKLEVLATDGSSYRVRVTRK